MTLYVHPAPHTHPPAHLASLCIARDRGNVPMVLDMRLGGGLLVAAIAHPELRGCPPSLDQDMLQVGNVGLSLLEQKSHFCLWCLISGPLLISTDLTQIGDEALAILKKREVIAVSQDPLAKQGVRIGPNGSQEVWAKFTVGGMAVVLLNRADAGSANVTVSFADLGKPGAAPARVRDLYEEKPIGSFAKAFTAIDVPPHGVVMVNITWEGEGGA